MIGDPIDPAPFGFLVAMSCRGTGHERFHAIAHLGFPLDHLTAALGARMTRHAFPTVREVKRIDLGAV